MITTILGWLLSLLTGIVEKRVAAEKQAKADKAQDAGSAAATEVAHASEAKVEQERTHDQSNTDRVRTDGPDVHGSGGSLLDQSHDINAAIHRTDNPV